MKSTYLVDFKVFLEQESTFLYNGLVKRQDWSHQKLSEARPTGWDTVKHSMNLFNQYNNKLILFSMIFLILIFQLEWEKQGTFRSKSLNIPQTLRSEFEFRDLHRALYSISPTLHEQLFADILSPKNTNPKCKEKSFKNSFVRKSCSLNVSLQVDIVCSKQMKALL